MYMDVAYRPNQSTMEAQLQLVKKTAHRVCCFLQQALELECNGCVISHPHSSSTPVLCWVGKITSGSAYIKPCFWQIGKR